MWWLRCKDLIDSYRPDLLYFDNSGLPLGQAGLDMAAHYYNSSLSWHGGLPVLNCKMLPEDRRPAVVEDVERGFRSEVVPHPWQTDTCIGDWHYRRSTFEQHKYKSAASVIRMLIDIVSKNGNYLLNVGPTSEGLIPQPSIDRLQQVGARQIVPRPAGFVQIHAYGRQLDVLASVRPHVGALPADALVAGGGLDLLEPAEE